MKTALHSMISRFGFNSCGACALLLAFLSGCATSPAKKESVKPTFFPPAPDEPRVQFLTAFSSDVQLGRRGSFAEYVTGATAPPSGIAKPYGLAIQDGKIFVCDSSASVLVIFDLAKKRGRYFAPSGESHFETPINIAIDTDGTRYVTDTARNQVLIFGKDDSFKAAIGTKGELKPCDLAITADRLYIADVKGHSVRVYDKAQRKELFSIPRDPKAEEGKLFSPTNLTVDKERGRLLVTDTGASAVKVYDLEGKYLLTIGQQGVAPGLFARPKGVAVDREGNIYVVDAATQVVQIFNSEGKLLMYFGQPGTTTYGELVLPAAVEVDYDNVKYFQQHVAPGYQCEYLILVTSQFGSRMVNVYGFVKKK